MTIIVDLELFQLLPPLLVRCSREILSTASLHDVAGL
jgi:hypothetical protein